jgi:AAT family amino acid transporter
LQTWMVALGIIVSLFNLIHVRAFGELEYWLSWTKLLIIAGFSIAAILIFFGFVGIDRSQIIGKTYLLDNGGFFPKGLSIFLANLVIMISSFQGTEIVGITASETKEAHIAVPRSLKQISCRLFLVYFVPTLLLVSIYPWQNANLSGSVFAAALYMYGLNFVGKIFNVLVVAGSVSCANSGIYSTIRALHALSIKGFAPCILRKVSPKGVPINASLFTLVAIWLILGLAFIMPPHVLYANLLALTGFSGSIAWIAICASQFYFRKKYNSQKEQKPLSYAIKLFPYSTQFAIWLQIACLCVLLLSPQLRYSFYFGVPSFVLPMLLYKFTLYYRKKHKLDL